MVNEFWDAPIPKEIRNMFEGYEIVSQQSNYKTIHVKFKHNNEHIKVRFNNENNKTVIITETSMNTVFIRRLLKDKEHKVINNLRLESEKLY